MICFLKRVVSFLFIKHISLKYLKIVFDINFLLVLMRSHLCIFKRSYKVSIQFRNKKPSLKGFTDSILKLSTIMRLTVRKKLYFIPELSVDPMRKVIVFKQVYFLTMLFLRKLIVKNFKIFLYCCVLDFKTFFNHFNVGLILSQST